MEHFARFTRESKLTETRQLNQRRSPILSFETTLKFPKKWVALRPPNGLINILAGTMRLESLSIHKTQCLFGRGVLDHDECVIGVPSHQYLMFFGVHPQKLELVPGVHLFDTITGFGG